jgi:outer membrane protein TolC
MHYNEEQVRIAQAGYDAGSLVRTDLLQSKIDLNVTRENAINQQFNIDAAKRYLGELLGKGLDFFIEVSDSIPLNYSPDKKDLFQKIDSTNTTLLSFQKQIDIARLNLKENGKLYAPVLNFTGGYYFSLSNNSSGTITNNRTFGPQLGGNLSIPVYSAGETKRKIATAKIQLKTAMYDFQSIALQVKTDLQNALTGFENQEQLLKIEKENKELARENLQISLQRLRLGQTTSLEVHMAQENFVLSCTRLINFEYNLKIAETKLKQLIATL